MQTDFNTIHPSQIQDYLNTLYPPKKSNPEKLIEYNEPYIDQARYGKQPLYGIIKYYDNQKAEIFSHHVEAIEKIVELIKKIGLTVKGCSESGEADVMTTGGGYRGGVRQILFLNATAVNVFQEAVVKKFNETTEAV